MINLFFLEIKLLLASDLKCSLVFRIKILKKFDIQLYSVIT